MAEQTTAEQTMDPSTMEFLNSIWAGGDQIQNPQFDEEMWMSAMNQQLGGYTTPSVLSVLSSDAAPIAPSGSVSNHDIMDAIQRIQTDSMTQLKIISDQFLALLPGGVLPQTGGVMTLATFQRDVPNWSKRLDEVTTTARLSYWTDNANLRFPQLPENESIKASNLAYYGSKAVFLISELNAQNGDLLLEPVKDVFASMVQFCVDAILQERDELLRSGRQYFANYGFNERGPTNNMTRYKKLRDARKYLHLPQGLGQIEFASVPVVHHCYGFFYEGDQSLFRSAIKLTQKYNEMPKKYADLFNWLTRVPQKCLLLCGVAQRHIMREKRQANWLPTVEERGWDAKDIERFARIMKDEINKSGLDQTLLLLAPRFYEMLLNTIDASQTINPQELSIVRKSLDDTITSGEED